MGHSPRKLPVYLDGRDPALAPIYDFAATAYPGQPIGNAIREVLIAGLGTNLFDPMLSAARQAAYYTASVRARRHLATSLVAMARDLESEALEMEVKIAANQAASQVTASEPCPNCGYVRSAA